MDDLAVVTVNYKNYSVTEAFLKSFAEQEKKNFKIFLIDLSPEPEDIESFGLNVDIIRGENKGYAYGLNVGLKNALDQGYKRFVCMNNDTEVHENFVSAALQSIKDHPLSLIGGKIYYYPGYEYHKDRYKKEDLGRVLWYAGGIIDWNNVASPHLGVDEVDEGNYEQIGETEFVTGCLMMFDKSFLEAIGMIDESYVMYYEDADWSIKARRAGIKLYFDPNVIIWHKNGQSSDGPGSNAQLEYMRKNRLKFGLRYAPLRSKIHLLKNHILGS